MKVVNYERKVENNEWHKRLRLVAFTLFYQSEANHPVTAEEILQVWLKVEKDKKYYAKKGACAFNEREGK